MNYKITKQEGKMVEVTNTRSGMTHKGTLFANDTKVAFDKWGGRNMMSPKIVKVA